MRLRDEAGLSGILVLAAALLPAGASAQIMPYSNVTGAGSGNSLGGNAAGGTSASPSAQGGDTASEPEYRHARQRSRLTPFIEASQVVTRESAPSDEVLTYSRLAAGVEGAVYGVNTEGAFSLRYQRNFGWKKQDRDSDAVSGIARGSMRVAPGVTIDGGALALRTSVERGGGAALGALGRGDAVTQVYSIYGGPSVSGMVGPVALNSQYKIGYSRTEVPNSLPVIQGGRPIDLFDDSVTHMAGVSASVKPGEVLPVGVSAGGTFYREDISNLDQRVDDLSGRVGIVAPISPDLAVVAGVGYERVRVSSRDAVRDAKGNPVMGSGGHYATDKSAPRVMAYDTEGLIWDAGVLWRPSRRTSLAAHVGRRYGSTSIYGSFAYAAGSRSTINVSVYDNVAGFGGAMTRALSGLPTEFTAVRNPLNGDLAGCVSAVGPDAKGSGICLTGALGSVRSSVFRGRGIMASYSLELGRVNTGLGVGYDRRKFIGAPGTVLALYNGVIDENMWLNAWMSGQLDRQSSVTGNIYANWFQSGSGLDGDARTIGATAAYNRYLTGHISATAALGLDGVNRDAPLDDYWIASALLGVRYSF